MSDSDGRTTNRRTGVRLSDVSTALSHRFGRVDELLRDGGTMAVATVLAGGLNYAYQVFVGRLLGPEQYGVFGALTSLFYLVNVVGRGIRFSSARFTAELRTDPGRLSVFHRGLLVRTFVFSLVLFAILTAGSTSVAGFLDVDSPLLVLLVASVVPFSLTLPANFGFFQGVESFVRFGAYKVLQAGLTFGLAVVLLTLGYGLYGAFGALLAATAVAFLVSTVHARTEFEALSGDVSLDVDYGRTYRYVLPAILAGFCLTVPTSVDVILAKHFFTSQDAGLYTAVSVLGKVLVFLPLGISMALFPKVSATVDSGGTEGLFRNAFLYTAILAGAGTLVYWTVPRAVLGLVYTSEYATAWVVLQWYGLAIFAYSLAVVVLNYQLARDERRFVYLFTLLSLVEIWLLWTYHGSMVGYARILLGVNAVLVAAGLVEVRR